MKVAVTILTCIYYNFPLQFRSMSLGSYLNWKLVRFEKALSLRHHYGKTYNYLNILKRRGYKPRQRRWTRLGSTTY